MAVILNFCERRKLSREDIVHSALTCNVLYLTSREVKVRSQLMGILNTNVLQHGTPNLGLHVGIWLVELNLVEESTLKSLVEIAREVGGGNEDTIEVFNLLKNDVLHGVVHLVNGVLNVLCTLVDDGIGLIEERMGITSLFLHSLR